MAAPPPLPAFDDLAGPLPVPLRAPALRACFEALRAQGVLLDRGADLATAEDFRWRAYGFTNLGLDADAEGLLAAVPPLAGDPHGFVRTVCAWALGQRPSADPARVREALEARIRLDPVWSVGRRAALSLGRLEGPAYVAAWWDRHPAAELLPWVRRGLLEAMEPAAWTDEALIRWLAAGGPEAWDALIFAVPPERVAGLELPADLRARLQADPWTRDQLAARWGWSEK